MAFLPNYLTQGVSGKNEQSAQTPWRGAQCSYIDCISLRRPCVYCTVPAKKCRQSHRQHCSNKQQRSETNKKLRLEKLVCSVGANLHSIIHRKNCFIERKTSRKKEKEDNRFSSNAYLAKNH